MTYDGGGDDGQTIGTIANSPLALRKRTAERVKNSINLSLILVADCDEPEEQRVDCQSRLCNGSDVFVLSVKLFTLSRLLMCITMINVESYIRTYILTALGPLKNVMQL